MKACVSALARETPRREDWREETVLKDIFRHEGNGKVGALLRSMDHFPAGLEIAAAAGLCRSARSPSLWLTVVRWCADAINVICFVSHFSDVVCIEF